MQLSIVDTSQVTEGATAREALRSTSELAQLADRLGYARYWVAEHHGAGRTNANSSPEVLIPRAASITSDIRVGRAAQPPQRLRIAETFKLLHAMPNDTSA